MANTARHRPEPSANFRSQQPFTQAPVSSPPQTEAQEIERQDRAEREGWVRKPVGDY